MFPETILSSDKQLKDFVKVDWFFATETTEFKFKKINEELAFLLNSLQGQLLHAETLEFTHPIKNKWVKFKSELPKDFKKMQSFLEKVHG